MPLMTKAQVPQMPSRQSESKAIGASPRAMSPSLTTSSISRKDMSGTMSLAVYSTRAPVDRASFCLQTFKVKFIAAPGKLLVAPLRHVDILVNERFLVQQRRFIHSLVLPRGDKREVLVVSLRLAIGGLVFDAEMASAGLLARQSIEAEQFGEFHKICDASGRLQILV